MVRHVRLFAILIIASSAAGALQGVLGIGDEGVTFSLDGLIGLCFSLAAMLVVVLSDREFFGLSWPEDEHARPGAHGH